MPLCVGESSRHALTGRPVPSDPEKMTASFTLFARRFCFAVLVALAMPAAWAFGLDDVAARASSFAAKPYQAPVINMPAALRDLDYDAYRDIRFRPEKALW